MVKKTDRADCDGVEIVSEILKVLPAVDDLSIPKVGKLRIEPNLRYLAFPSSSSNYVKNGTRVSIVQWFYI